MLEIFKSGGILMWPLLLCSLAAIMIIIEKFWMLKTNAVVPSKLQAQITELIEAETLEAHKVEALRRHSSLGEVLAAGIRNRAHGRDQMKQAIEESGRFVIHRLSKRLNALGTIASVSPLVGLLGTVVGMIQVFAAIRLSGVGDPTVLSGGISQALITTAVGLAIGIVSLLFYRYFKGKVEQIAILLERNAIHLVELATAKRASAIANTRQSNLSTAKNSTTMDEKSSKKNQKEPAKKTQSNRKVTPKGN